VFGELVSEGCLARPITMENGTFVNAVLRKVNPFNLAPLARSSFLNAFGLEFARVAESLLL
jgi:hypothetical protein